MILRAIARRQDCNADRRRAHERSGYGKAGYDVHDARSEGASEHPRQSDCAGKS
jgi:hypothetical protein